MTTVTKAAAQWKLSVGPFVMNIATDAMSNSASPSVLTNFKATTGTTFNIATLPANSVVVGGELNVITASNDSGTATLAVGDKNSSTRYLAATNIKATGRTALTLTGLLNTAAIDVLVTLANQNGDATTGQVYVTLDIVILGRVNENLKMV